MANQITPELLEAFGAAEEHKKFLASVGYTKRRRGSLGQSMCLKKDATEARLYIYEEVV